MNASAKGIPNMPGRRKSSGFGYDFPLFNEKPSKRDKAPTAAASDDTHQRDGKEQQLSLTADGWPLIDKKKIRYPPPLGVPVIS